MCYDLTNEEEDDKNESNGQNNEIHKNREAGTTHKRENPWNSVLNTVDEGVLSQHDFILNFNLISHQRYANV